MASEEGFATPARAPRPGGDENATPQAYAPTPCGYVARKPFDGDTFMARKLATIAANELAGVADRALGSVMKEGRKKSRLEREQEELKERRHAAAALAEEAQIEALFVTAIAEATGGVVPPEFAAVAVQAVAEARRAHSEVREPYTPPELPRACTVDESLQSFGGAPLDALLTKKLSKLELEQLAAKREAELARVGAAAPKRLSAGFDGAPLDALLTKKLSKLELEQLAAKREAELARVGAAAPKRLSAGFDGAPLDALLTKKLSKLELEQLAAKREERDAEQQADSRQTSRQQPDATAAGFEGGLGVGFKKKMSRLEREKAEWQARNNRS